MKMRHTEFLRLAGFLRTGDYIDPKEGTGRTLQPKAQLSHPPPFTNPAQVYYLPAILTPAQQKFLDNAKASAKTKVDNEKAAWETEKKSTLVEIKKLRDKVAEYYASNPPGVADDAEVDVEPKSANAAASAAVEDQMDVEETPVEQQADSAAVDNEDAIEY